jgi:hypothetical protein
LGSKWCINKTRAEEKASLCPVQTCCLLSVIWRSPQPSPSAFRAWLWGQPSTNRTAHCSNQTVPRAGGLCLWAYQLACWQMRNLASKFLIRMVPVFKYGSSVYWIQRGSREILQAGELVDYKPWNVKVLRVFAEVEDLEPQANKQINKKQTCRHSCAGGNVWKMCEPRNPRPLTTKPNCAIYSPYILGSVTSPSPGCLTVQGVWEQ